MMDVRHIGHEKLEREGFVFADMFKRELKCEPLMFDGVVFGVCTRGVMRLRIDYREIEVRENEMFAVFPKHIFTLLEKSDDLDVKAILVSLDFICTLPLSPGFEWLKKAEASPSVSLKPDKREEMLALYAVMEKYGTDTAAERQIRGVLMLALILILKTMYDGASDDVPVRNCSRQENLTHAFFDLMSCSFTSERRVSFYADKLCVTPKYLSAAVKSVTGHTVQEWIDEAVIIEAKRTLRTSDFSVQQISEQLHFQTPSSFVRFFRQHTGFTPSVYRRM